MKKTLMAIAAMLLISLNLQAQSLTSQASHHIAFDEMEQSAAPRDAAIKQPCIPMNGQKFGKVVIDPQMGHVRRFEVRENGIATKQLKVNGSDARTYSIWVNVDKTAPTKNDPSKMAPQANCPILTTGAMAQPHGGFTLQMIQGNSIKIGTDKDFTSSILFSGTEDLRGSWHHIAVTVQDGAKASEVRVYVDGKPLGKAKTVDSTKKNAPIGDYKLNTTKGIMQIGAGCSAMMSDLAIFNRALSEAEIATLIQETK